METDVITNTEATELFTSGADRYLGIRLRNIDNIRIPVGYDYSFFKKEEDVFNQMNTYIRTGGKTVEWGMINGNIVDQVVQNNGVWRYPANESQDISIKCNNRGAVQDLTVTDTQQDFSDDSIRNEWIIGPTESAIITGVASIVYLAIKLPSLDAELQRIRAYGLNAVNTALSMFWAAILTFRGYDEHGNVN